MSWVKGLLVLLMLLSASFAAVEAGNASDSAATRCGPDVQAVYSCSAGIVKAVSSDGSTFYKPDGTVLACPDVAPSQRPAACVQLLLPNYCPTQVTCVQSAQVVSANVTNGSGNATNGSPQAPAPLNTAAKAPATPAVTAKSDINIPAAAPATADFSMDNLALVVLLLGAISVGVIFTMFKNSISE